MSYTIRVHNQQGASDGHVGTRQQINAWLAGWADPQNLTATVIDASGAVIASKPYGRKAISWPPGRPRLPDDERQTARIEVRMTEAQRDKLDRLGGAAWIRDRIDRSRV